MRHRLHLCVVLGSVLLTAPALAEVQTSNQVEHYEIRGTSAAQLRAEMSARGPTGPSGGRRFDGYTRWNVSWRYTFKSGGGQCTIDRVTTEVKVTTTLPRWADEARADNPLRDQWRRYLAALTQHEDGHAQNGLGAARDIDAGIARLPAEPNCGAMGERANAAGQAVLRQYNQRDLDYDRETGHGRSQGAVFP
jgi:predicted secreted Zn-dependent protease